MLFLAGNVGSAAVAVLGLVSIDRGLDDAPGSADLVDLSNTLDAWAVVAMSPLYVAGVVLAIRWLLAAVRNVEALTGAPPRRSPRWAAWSWFVPGVWWVIPKLVVDELWRSGDGRRDGRVARLVQLWWTLWLLEWAVSVVAAVVWWGIDGEELAPYRPGYAWDLVACALAIPGIVLSILVIRRITARQEASAAS